jgi:hypothetical protein
MNMQPGLQIKLKHATTPMLLVVFVDARFFFPNPVYIVCKLISPGDFHVDAVDSESADGALSSGALYMASFRTDGMHMMHASRIWQVAWTRDLHVASCRR